MINKLKAKLKNQGGFTLVEMLIVVAIIAILVAVSIPMFNGVLERARHGVDAANRRDAISLGTMEFVSSLNPKEEFENPVYYDYRVDESGDHQGALVLSTAGSDAGVKPQCTHSTATHGLQVKVEYKPNETDILNQVQVTTNWTIDGTTGVVTTQKFS